MSDLPLALALTAGMLAAVNPRVVDAILRHLGQHFGNPSSSHPYSDQPATRSDKHARRSRPASSPFRAKSKSILRASLGLFGSMSSAVTQCCSRSGIVPDRARPQKAASFPRFPRERGSRRQWPAVSWPARRSCMSALGSFRPMMVTFLPRCLYLVSMASRAATDEASQMWASVRSMTTSSGSSL